MLKYVDLFSGTGGIRLGLQQVLQEYNIPSQCIKSAEIDDNACETYQQNFNENPKCDVASIGDLEPFDLLLAGFPCQSFSYAGKQRGFGDTRGTLFFEVEKILQKYKPRMCFLENVRGLTSHDNGRTFQTILSRLHDIGYHTEYRLLNSSNFGVPQNRVRIYIVAFLGKKPLLSLNSDLGATDSHDFKSYSQKLTLFGNNYQFRYVRDILEDSPNIKYDCSNKFRDKLTELTNGDLTKLNGIRFIDTRNGNSIHSWELGLKGKCNDDEVDFMNLLVSNRRKHTFGTHQDGKALTIDQIATFYQKNNLDKIIVGLLKKGYISEKEGKYNPVCGNLSFEVFKFLDPNSISITLTASDTHKLGVYHNGRVRRLTPRECARLQGYPDSYLLHPKDTYAYKQIGNAVSVPVIKEIFSDIIANNKIVEEILNKDVTTIKIEAMP